MTRDRAWIWWVSVRFILGRRNGKGRLLFLFSVLLIAAGVCTLNTVLAVMNGLQQGYIRNILEIGSYHIRWTPESRIDFRKIKELASRLETVPDVQVAQPFREGKTILSGLFSRQAPALIRGYEIDSYIRDPAFARSLTIVDGDFRLDGSSVVLGERLALSLNVQKGDRIFAVNIDSNGASQVEMTVAGIFRCSYAEYESVLAFVSIDTSRKIFLRSATEIGMKISDINRDLKVMEAAESLLSGEEGRLQSWKELNKSFFGALRTEKNMMFLLLALIFIVVAVNIDQSLRRMFTERMEDIAILRALGSSTLNVRFLFIFQGLFIGGSGALSGTFLGILLAGNIDKVALIFFRLTNTSRNLWSMAVFRSAEVILRDVILILLVSVVLATLAALHSARLAASLKPREILRGE